MSAIWLVTRYEYSRHVLRRRFLATVLSVPILILIMIAIGFLVARLQEKDLPIGYVDGAGVLRDPTLRPRTAFLGISFEMIAFPNETQAQGALEAGQIQAFYVLPPDYLSTGRARLIYKERPGPAAQEAFADLLRANLLVGQPDAVVQRLTEGTNLIVRSADGRRELNEGAWVNLLVPFFIGFAFMFAIFSSSGYLMQALVEEKENRTMEILITSISPQQMMVGKIFGLIGVGLTQLLAWVGAALALIAVGGGALTWLRSIHLEAGMLALSAAVMIPSFVLFAALMTTIGASVSDEREGQQMTGLITLPAAAPYWFTFHLMNNPNGPLALALSYFPLTTPVALTLRAGFTTIPPWQIALNLAVLSLAAAGALWLAGRALRLGMLRYGQRLRLGELIGRGAKGRHSG